MKTDSDTTRTQKGRIRAAIADELGHGLPDWLVEGATLAQLRIMLRVLRDARKRYAAASEPEPGPTELTGPFTAARLAHLLVESYGHAATSDATVVLDFPEDKVKTGVGTVTWLAGSIPADTIIEAAQGTEVSIHSLIASLTEQDQAGQVQLYLASDQDASFCYYTIREVRIDDDGRKVTLVAGDWISAG